MRASRVRDRLRSLPPPSEWLSWLRQNGYEPIDPGIAEKSIWKHAIYGFGAAPIRLRIKDAVVWGRMAFEGGLFFLQTQDMSKLDWQKARKTFKEETAPVDRHRLGHANGGKVTRLSQMPPEKQAEMRRLYSRGKVS